MYIQFVFRKFKTIFGAYLDIAEVGYEGPPSGDQCSPAPWNNT